MNIKNIHYKPHEIKSMSIDKKKEPLYFIKYRNSLKKCLNLMTLLHRGYFLCVNNSLTAFLYFLPNNKCIELFKVTCLEVT